jgi:hypothetical protein
VLGRSSPDFTWYYVPLGAYSVFEPLGGILCTNLPIIWHMIRKRRALDRDHNGFQKTKNSSTPTIGSGSRVSRIIHRLGVTTHDRTRIDSAARTILDGSEGTSGSDFTKLESLESQKPDPMIWATVERVDAAASDEHISEANLKPGMKKTVWNVRR